MVIKLQKLLIIKYLDEKSNKYLFIYYSSLYNLIIFNVSFFILKTIIIISEYINVTQTKKTIPIRIKYKNYTTTNK